MLQIDTHSKIPYYVQIYTYYRDEITARRMPAGMKMASVRELAQRAGVSKMTVEKAYYQLASEDISSAAPRRGTKSPILPSRRKRNGLCTGSRKTGNTAASRL